VGVAGDKMNGYIGFNRPQLDEIQDRVFTVLDENLPESSARIPYTPLNLLATAAVGLSHEMYGYLEWVAKQTNIQDCEGEQLDKYGRIWGVYRIPSSYNNSTVEITGSNGQNIFAGTEIQALGSKKYVTLSDAVISGGKATVTVLATVAGSAYNLPDGTQAALSIAQSGVNSKCQVIGTLALGADEELDTLYRQRILDRITMPPHGGNAKDYVDWCKQVSGVTRVWPVGKARGKGTVDIRFAMDGLRPSGIPNAGDVANVQAYLDTVTPITADVIVYAPVAVPVDIVISGLEPNTDTAKAAIAAELADLFDTRSDLGGTMYFNWLYDTVSNAISVDHFLITSPTTNVTCLAGQLLTLGNIIYV
jgi:uncharacterized phage protein gp47/JayE